jgi:hypothetical protein
MSSLAVAAISFESSLIICFYCFFFARNELLFEFICSATAIGFKSRGFDFGLVSDFYDDISTSSASAAALISLAFPTADLMLDIELPIYYSTSSVRPIVVCKLRDSG